MARIDHKNRISSLKREIEKKGLDSFLVTNETNVSYLSGFKGSDSFLLITRSKDFFITDSRFAEEAKGSLNGFDIALTKVSTYETLRGLIKRSRLKKVGFESMNLPYEVAMRLKGLLKKTRLVPVKDLVETTRSVKERCEIELLKRAVRLTRIVLDETAGLAKPGASEIFLAARIETELIRRGARPSFPPIVAAGQNSSKPHALPSDARVENNSFVMIDMGAGVEGYKADMTRMVIVGKVSPAFKKIYTIVRIAQELAIKKVRPGAKAYEVDRAGRRYIEEKGYGRYFGHSLGHGLGLEVHEKPSISKTSDAVLRPGMVFTVEPAIYIPRFGGVRIEDMVLVTDNGCEVLTR